MRHEADRLPPRKRFYLGYWTEFISRLESHGLHLFAKRKADYALWFKLVKPKRYMYTMVFPKEVYIYVGMGTSDWDLWPRLLAVKDQVGRGSVVKSARHCHGRSTRRGTIDLPV